MLQAFLGHPSRPTGTLTYHELQGFLFAVVTAPELIRPSEWLPLVFNEEQPGFSTAEEANTVLGEIMGLYNDINAAVLDERVVLPADCKVSPRAIDNLDDSSPLACWSRGFLIGHEWLEDLWNVDFPADLDEEVGSGPDDAQLLLVAAARRSVSSRDCRPERLARGVGRVDPTSHSGCTGGVRALRTGSTWRHGQEPDTIAETILADRPE